MLTDNPLLAIGDISAVQSSAQTLTHNSILFIDTSKNAGHHICLLLLVIPGNSLFVAHQNAPITSIQTEVLLNK